MFGVYALLFVTVSATPRPAAAAAQVSTTGVVPRPASEARRYDDKQRAAKTERRDATKSARKSGRKFAGKARGKSGGKSSDKSARKSRGKPATKTANATPSESGLPFGGGRPSQVVPNQTGKVVVFPFRNDDRDLVSTQVGQLLAARGFEVMTDVKPVDSAEQYRDMATALGVVAYVDGDVKGTEQSTRATIRLRSGFSGRKITQTAVTESRTNLPRELSDRLWTKLGPAMAHACVDAGKPRKKSRTLLQINAGTPIETTPSAEPASRPPAAARPAPLARSER